MDAIDSILDNYPQKPSGIASGEAMVWNGTGWARSSVTRISTIRPQDLGQDAATSGQVLKWNGSIWAPATMTSGPLQTWGATGSPLATVVSTTTETTVVDITIDSSMIVAGNRIKLFWWYDYLHNNATGDGLTFTVRHGGTSAGTDGTVVGQGGYARMANQISATVVGGGGMAELAYYSTTAAVAVGTFAHQQNTSLSSLNASSIVPVAASAPAVSTSDTHFKLTCTLDASSANHRVRVYGYKAFLMSG